MCYGGLGFLDLKITGYALRLRWEWLRRTQPELNWCSLPHRPERAVQAMFHALVSVIISDGRSAKFWTDSWLPEGPICRFAPHLFNAIGKRRPASPFETRSPTEAGSETS
jgi:hypothetical protein